MPPRKSDVRPPGPFPVVGIGASAGGLEAFTRLLSGLSPTTGMAYVLVQHLDPDHASMLAPILSKTSTIPVSEAKNGTRLEANQAYVIPPGGKMSLVDGRLKIVPRERGRQNAPIDFFFRSLAEHRHSRAIGVILSGTGSDGMLGLEAIKAEGGVTFAQEEKSAKFSLMPHSAIASGCVDFVMPPEQIAVELERIARHAVVRQGGEEDGQEPTAAEKPAMDRILKVLRSRMGVDFTTYKVPTIRRRIGRRIAVHRQKDVAAYADFLEKNPAETDALYHDLLIKVTSFFRDPATFSFLKQRVFPALMRGRAKSRPVRFWVPGCCTGEEAYSLAIAFIEFLGKRAGSVPFSVFGTDLSDQVIDRARAGVYPESIAADVTRDRLDRFFKPGNGTFQIQKSIRDLCIFARHDITRDPPFSRIDLISCRNVLIYLDASLQKRIFDSFHFALQPDSFLLLGSSETVGTSTHLFSPVAGKHRVYRRRDVRVATLSAFASDAQSGARRDPGTAPPLPKPSRKGRLHDIDQLILSRYSPPGVLIDRENEVLQFRGNVAPFLSPAPGRATFNLFRMTHESLAHQLRTTLLKARKSSRREASLPVRMTVGTEVREVTIEVMPVATSGEPCDLVLFSATKLPGQPKGRKGAKRPKEVANEIARLEEELASTKQSLQATLEDYDATNEENKSANEEILSSNEELQSTNEELETAKEELQSANEELTTLNEELQNRNQELLQVNDDITNLLTSVNIPVLMLGKDMRIRRLTPMAERLLNVIPADVGRPITDIRMKIDVPELAKAVAESFAGASMSERQVRDEEGRWYSVIIRPYRTRDNRIDGVVVLFLDVDVQKRALLAARKACDYAEAMAETVSQPVLLLDGTLHVRRANQAFYREVGTRRAQIEGRLAIDLFQGDVARLLDALTLTSTQGPSFEHLTLDSGFRQLAPRTLRFSARRVFLEDEHDVVVILVIDDVTDLLRSEEQHAQLAREQQARRNAEKAVHSREEFLSIASHELNTAVAALQLQVESIQRSMKKQGSTDTASAEGLDAVSRLGLRLTELVARMMDLSRIRSGQLTPVLASCDLSELARVTVARFKDEAEREKCRLVLEAPEEVAGLWDRALLESALGNLISNAVKFGKGKDVRVSVSADDGKALLRVEDEGPGIHADERPRLFRPFEKGVGAKKGGGLGLGLYIVNEITTAHGGRVHVGSGDGRGAAITMELPRKPASA